MPIKMICPWCDKTLSAPDTAAGKEAQCPTCGTVMIVTPGMFEAEEFGATSAEPAAPEFSVMDDYLGATQSQSFADSGAAGQDTARRPCPKCGENIVANAPKCRFCGAVFDARLMGWPMHRGQSYQGFAIMSMVSGVVGIFTFHFFILFPLVAVALGGTALNGMNKARNNDGKRMAITGLTLGILACFRWGLRHLLTMAMIHHR